MADEDYESLPINCSPPQHMLAGACAGVMEHVLMYPVDMIKTRVQCINPAIKEPSPYVNLRDGLRKAVMREGFRSYKGVGVVVVGAAPAHALYFGSYEAVKARFVKEGQSRWHQEAIYGFAGLVATVLHDAVMTPADAVKQRLQILNSPYRNSCDCFQRVVAVDGLRALYRAYWTQLAMNAPQQASHFMAYEWFQHTLNPKGHYSPSTHVIAGGLAGGIAAFITTPLDVCKTLLNTQDECGAFNRLFDQKSDPSLKGSHSKKVRGLFGAARLIFGIEGLSGFFRGWSARVCFQMPGTAVSWLVYESFKWQLRQNHYTSDGISNSPMDALKAIAEVRDV